jgi:hypothetical protein
MLARVVTHTFVVCLICANASMVGGRDLHSRQRESGDTRYILGSQRESGELGEDKYEGYIYSSTWRFDQCSRALRDLDSNILRGRIRL